jgi:hypothetical protein
VPLIGIALPGLMPMPGGSAHAGIGLEERKLSMKFRRIIPCYRLLDLILERDIVNLVFARNAARKTQDQPAVRQAIQHGEFFGQP